MAVNVTIVTVLNKQLYVIVIMSDVESEEGEDQGPNLGVSQQ